MSEVGGALRFNENKPQFNLLILQDVVDSLEHKIKTKTQNTAWKVLAEIAAFQLTKEDKYLVSAMELLVDYWYDCVSVFEYGAKKYSEWNWLKGMKWNFHIASMSRHLMTILMTDIDLDDESGCTHLGHALCNIVMLRHNIRKYPELDDIPDF